MSIILKNEIIYLYEDYIKLFEENINTDIMLSTILDDAAHNELRTKALNSIIIKPFRLENTTTAHWTF